MNQAQVTPSIATHAGTGGNMNVHYSTNYHGGARRWNRLFVSFAGGTDANVYVFGSNRQNKSDKESKLHHDTSKTYYVFTRDTSA